MQPDSLSELVIEAIDAIPVDELEVVNGHAIQEQCMNSFEMPWMKHLPKDLNTMATEYYIQFYCVHMFDWIEDPVYVKGYYYSKSIITGMINEAKRVRKSYFINPITFKQIPIARKYNTHAEFSQKLFKSKELTKH